MGTGKRLKITKSLRDRVVLKTPHDLPSPKPCGYNAWPAPLLLLQPLPASARRTRLEGEPAAPRGRLGGGGPPSEPATT